MTQEKPQTVAEAMAERDALKAELAKLKKESIKDVIKLPVSGDLYRIRHEGAEPTEREDNVRLSPRIEATPQQLASRQAALEYAASQALKK